MKRDNKDPQELGTLILRLKEYFNVGIKEAADMAIQQMERNESVPHVQSGFQFSSDVRPPQGG